MTGKPLMWDEAQANNALEHPDPRLPTYEGVPEHIRGPVQITQVTTRFGSYTRYEIGDVDVDPDSLVEGMVYASEHFPGADILKFWGQRDEKGHFDFEGASHEGVSSIKALNTAGFHKNDVGVIKYKDGSRAIFKPANGEKKTTGFRERSGIAQGDLYQREVATAQLDKALKFGNVPATTEVTIKGEAGSVQTMVEGATHPGDISGFSAVDQQQMAVLDLVTGQGDRRAANYMDNAGRAVAIDNGRSFPDDKTGTGRVSPFIAAWDGKQLSASVLDKVRSVDTAKLDKAWKAAGLSSSAREGALFRLASIAKSGTIDPAMWKGQNIYKGDYKSRGLGYQR